MVQNDKYFQKQIEIATEIRKETPVPVFSQDEKRILSRVFSNTDKNTFFIYGLPEELVTALLARYSRIKHPRGIRGLFLEEFITNLPVMGRLFVDPEGCLQDYGQKTLDQFSEQELSSLVGMGFSLEHYRSVVTGEKIRDFLRKFLDAYGHNSIARMGMVHLAIESISLLAAKVIEWGRPGAGYIELSTRFVDMGAKGLYPVWQFFADSSRARSVQNHINQLLESYEQLVPICRDHFLKLFGHMEPSEAAIMGKVFDSLGNLLPGATQTSVGISLMGESYQGLVRHLLGENSPECYILAQEIAEEAARTGNAILLGSHYHPALTDEAYYGYKLRNFVPSYNNGPCSDVMVQRDFLVPNAMALESISRMSGREIDEEFIESRNLFMSLGNSRQVQTNSYQKLPRWFEVASASFSGLMSFRSWRDLQRMGFCTHGRGWVSPENGCYMPPDMPEVFISKYSNSHIAESFLFSDEELCSYPVLRMLAQYGYKIGDCVPFVIGANLRQWEFVNWQRSKWTVNEEVRTVILKIENILRYEYPWWSRISRADLTPAYVFARGNKIISRAELTK